MPYHGEKLAILVAGGPAPGINSVISAATIRSCLEDVNVIGIRDGFERIMQGNIDHITPLTIEVVSRIHFRGGSHIGISRANPSLDPAHLESAVMSLLRLNVTQLITIGGDDTAASAIKLEQRAAGRIRVVHVPKTIDNDLALPPHVDTFGYQTARHHGVEIVKNLMVDAKTTSRWCFVIAMGRKAGHLALGIGKAAGATVTLVLEEFTGHQVRLKTVVDTLAGAIIKRLSQDRSDGVAVLAEGLVLGIDQRDLEGLDAVERDSHGNLRIAEVNIGEILKAQAARRLEDFGLKVTIVAKNIGYELRCADPIPSDWGIHLTGASARRAGNSPWSVRRRAFQAGWVPTGSRRRRWLHFGCGVNDEVSVAHRVVRDGELEHPVEHHPAAAGAAAVEAEHELIQVAGQVRGVDRALVRAQQPPLDQ